MFNSMIRKWFLKLKILTKIKKKNINNSNSHINREYKITPKKAAPNLRLRKIGIYFYWALSYCCYFYDSKQYSN